MILELTPETFFENVKVEGPLHVVMHYGEACGPCKRTLPIYEVVAQHFIDYGKGDRVKFYKFHHWEPAYKDFIEQNNLSTNGVPTFRFYYFGEDMQNFAESFTDANLLKRRIMDVSFAINSTIGGLDLNES
jgi:thiol-disulfide isomerase/thioredoxin